MRSLSLWLIVALFLIGINSATAGAQNLDRRQEDLETEATAEVTTTASEDQSTRTDQEETATSTTSATKSTITAATTTTSDVTTKTGGPDATRSGQAEPTSTSKDGAASDSDRLPLEPRISPAFAITGVVLLIAGVVYTLIGIKKRWAQVFLSTAFLAALSVAVLVVYVMNPPVSDATQGGYFVACFLTGVIFGGVSLVFQEITEGMGCLLGGFCLSMWLLALKPGGLLPETTGKVIFIAAFTVATYATSFSHYTRPYGLIGSTSFGGATATILGIDCFSRAGLKEFWLYIWGLNPEVFPLHTNTYPITRGIRVELACIVVACLLGIISQVKLWKVIRERRKAKLAAKADEEQQRDREEEEAGRNLEEANSREMAAWEATYGQAQDKQKADSGIGKDDSAIEKEDIDRSSSASRTDDMGDEGQGEDTAGEGPASCPGERSSSPKSNGSVLENQHGDEVISSEDGTGQVYTGSQEVAGTNSPNRMSNMSTAASADPNTVPQSPGGSRALSNPDTAQELPDNQGPGNMPPAPSVTPLPFVIPFSSLQEREGDELSVAASAGSDIDVNEFSRRFSRLSSFTRLSAVSGGSPSPEAEEILRSSIADRSRPVSGVVETETPNKHDDELPPEEDGYEMKTNPNSVDDQYDIPAEPQDFTAFVAREPENCESQEIDKEENRSSSNIEPGDETELKGSSSSPLPSPMLNVPENDRGTDARVSSGSTEKTADEASTSRGGLGRSGSGTKSTTSRTNSLTAGAVGMLPSHASGVTMSYRTNEWAKHLSHADIPSAEPIQQPALQGEADDPSLQEEPVMPLNVAELQQTPLSARPPPVVEHHATPTAPATSEDPNPVRPLTASGMSSEENAQPEVAIYSPGSKKQLRPSSQYIQSKGYATPNSLNSVLDSSPVHNGQRSCSTPFPVNSVHGSVIQEANEWESSSNREGSTSPAPPPLMAVRDSMVRNRMSSFMNRNSSAPTLTKYQQQAYTDPPAGAGVNSRAQSVVPPDDDIPLSQRREMIRQQSLNRGDSTTFSYTNSVTSHDYPRSGAPSAFSSRTLQTPDPEIQRQANLAAWRESVREEMAKEHVPETAVANRRADMLMEKRESLRGKQQETMMAQYRDRVLSDAMQRGDMQHLHREAMRKMQAEANKRT